MKASQRVRLRLLAVVTAVLASAALSGGLAGCGGAAGGPAPTPTRTPHAEATATSPPTATWTPAPSSTPTLSPYVNPLTGEHVDDPGLLERVPVAIKISNYPPQYVWPQAGINSADIIYEHYNEGRLSTRWTALYLAQEPGCVGPVRSGRLIDLELSAIYNAILTCSGFSPGVLDIFLDSDLYPDWVVSESLGDTINPNPFYRDTSRDVPYEHTMFTSPGLVRAWAAERGVGGRQDLVGMLFSEQPPLGGEPATVLRIPWRELDAEWRYDEASGRYLRWSDGAPHTDALDGRQLGAANVVVLYVPQWDTDIVEDLVWNIYSIRFALWDSNRAVILRDGVRIDAFWQRWERWDMLTLTDEAGNPIPLKVGNTFFEVIPTEGLEIVVE